LRKRRTRSHIIADLSANHVERQALLCGYSVERVVHDYGIDMVLYTYTEDGEIEAESIKIQLKATDRLSVLNDGETIAFSIERADLEYWLGEWLPVILVVFDAQEEVAYWVYIQAYFENIGRFSLALIGETTTVYFRKADLVDTSAMRLFARYKANILRQRPEIVHYDV
jgi:hypothetical protein